MEIDAKILYEIALKKTLMQCAKVLGLKKIENPDII